MKKVFVFSLFALALAACNKDKFKTQPQVEIKSLSPDEVFKGQLFTLRAIVRDKEGDIQDSFYLVRKYYLNDVVQGNPDTLRYTLKDFNVPLKSEIEVNAVFAYGELIDGYIFQNLVPQDRDFAVGVIIRDKEGNKSEYVESNKITLRKL